MTFEFAPGSFVLAPASLSSFLSSGDPADGLRDSPSGSSAVETVSLTMVVVSWLVGTEGSPLKSVAEAFHDDLGSLVSLSLL